MRAAGKRMTGGWLKIPEHFAKSRSNLSGMVQLTPRRLRLFSAADEVSACNTDKFCYSTLLTTST